MRHRAHPLPNVILVEAERQSPSRSCDGHVTDNVATNHQRAIGSHPIPAKAVRLNTTGLITVKIMLVTAALASGTT